MTRENKGILLVKAGAVREVSQSEYSVKSQRSGRLHAVTWQRDRWKCDCEDYAKRSGKKCKHIYAIQYFQIMREIILDADKLDSSMNSEIHCPASSSHKITFSGYRYNRSGVVRRIFCKRCHKRITLRPLERLHNEASMVVAALDSYFRGLSLRQTSEHLEATQKRKVSHTTIMRWIRKFVEILNLYVEKVLERNSRKKRKVRDDRWAADETLFRLSGRHMVLWSLLDEKTRYLLARIVTLSRNAGDAKRLLTKGLSKAEKPFQFLSDGAPQYTKASDEKFSKGKRIIHVQGPGLTHGINNNKIERMQGVMKNRLKSMGALRALESGTAFGNGHSIFYNFIKTHRALNGKTPGQERGIVNKKLSFRELLASATKI